MTEICRPVARDARLADRHRVILWRQLFLHPAVEKLVLEKADGIIVANRRLDEPFGVIGGCRADDFQSRHVREKRLGILRVKRTAVHAAAGGSAQHHRRGDVPAIVRLGQHVDDLIEGATDEVHELELDHRAQAGERSSEGGVDKRHLGDGRVDHPLGAEALDEALGYAKRASVDADVFADAEDRGVALHFFVKSLADSFEIGKCGHVFRPEPISKPKNWVFLSLVILSGAAERRSRRTPTLKPRTAQIQPTGVLSLNKPNFLSSHPALYLLLPVDCCANVAKALEIDEPIYSVPLGESLDLSLLVLPNALRKIVGYSYVQSPG